MKYLSRSIIILIASFVLVNEPAFAAIPSDDILDFYDSNNIYYYNPSGSNDYCDSTYTKLVGDTIEEKMWNFYVENGFTDAQTAGILGNAMAESGLEPTRASVETFFGLYQWGYGRKDNLFDRFQKAGLIHYTSREYWPVGASKNIPADDLEKILSIELDFSITEDTWDWQTEVKKQTTPEAAAEAFLVIFERAVDNGGPTVGPILYYAPYKGIRYQGAQARRDFAREFYDKYSGHGISVSGGDAARENGNNLTIIGDSITVASTNALRNKFIDLSSDNINAAASRTWAEAISIAKELNASSKIKDNVVFALGANSPQLTQKDIEDAIEAIGADRNITFVTDWSTKNDYANNNNLFYDFAKNYSNIVVADWKQAVENKADEYFYDNYIHPNDKGAKLFAEIIYNTVNGSLNAKGCSINGEFEKLVKAYAWPDWHFAPWLDRMPDYAAAVTQSISEGRYVGGSVRNVPGIDCGGFVTILAQNSGLAPDYNDKKGATETQEKWVKEHNWTLLNATSTTEIDTSILQPGDIAFSKGHTFIYVGDIPGFNSKIASASYSQDGTGGRAPMAGGEDLIRGNGAIVRWYRNPQFRSSNGTSYKQKLQNTVWSD